MTDPALAHTRARVASATRDVRRGRYPESKLHDAKRDHQAAVLEHYIQKALASAPPLSDEQRTRLAELLRPVRVTGGA